MHAYNMYAYVYSKCRPYSDQVTHRPRSTDAELSTSIKYDLIWAEWSLGQIKYEFNYEKQPRPD